MKNTKNHAIKRAATFLLALLTVLTMVPTLAVGAAEGDPIAISNVTDFKNMTGGNSYYLTQNIDFGTESVCVENMGADFTLDGKGFTITANAQTTPLFTITANVEFTATIQNLNVNAKLTMNSGEDTYCGIFWGNRQKSKIAMDNVHVTADIVYAGKTGSEIGGFFARSNGGTVKNSSMSGSISVTGQCKAVGGFTGLNGLTHYENCINNATITVSDVVKHTGVGGIVGQVNTATPEFKKCQNKGNITVTGYTDTTMRNPAGIVGASGKAFIVNDCSNTGVMMHNGTEMAKDLVGETAKSYADIIDPNAPQVDLTTPKPVSNAEEFNAMTVGTYYLTGDITFSKANPCTVNVGGTFNLDGKGFTVLGIDQDHSLFNVENKKNSNMSIKNLNIGTKDAHAKITANATNIAVLFTNKQSAPLACENVHIFADVTVTGLEGNKTSTNAIGGFVGVGGGVPSSFKNCSMNGSINSSGGIVGGFFGRQRVGDCVFENCVNNADIENPNGTYGTGGFIGRAEYAVSLTDCLNTGTVYGNTFAGGIIGNANSGIRVTITNCGNRGTISAFDNASGPIAGYSSAELTITGSYADLNVIATVEDFNAITAGKEYYLANDIDFTGKTALVNMQGVVALDGKGFKLIGIDQSNAIFNTNGYALTIKDLTIGTETAPASIKSTETGALGALVAEGRGKIVIDNVTVYANVEATAAQNGVGGLIGSGRYVTITNSKMYGTVKGGSVSGVGGFVGYVNRTLTVEGCANNAIVTGTVAGAIVGYAKNTAIGNFSIKTCTNADTANTMIGYHDGNAKVDGKVMLGLAANGGTHVFYQLAQSGNDVQVIFVVDAAKFQGATYTITVSFKNAEGQEVANKTFTTATSHATLTVNGVEYVADGGAAIYGVAITDVNASDWNTVEVSLDASVDALDFSGSASK